MKKIVITPIPLLDTQVPDKYNSNNHHALDYTYGKVLSEQDYHFYKAKSQRDTWAHLQPAEGVIEWQVPPHFMRILADAAKSGILTGRRPAIYAEELQEIQDKLPLIDNSNKKYFIRLSECSPKDGVHGCGPFTSRAQIIDALVTSERCLKTFSKDKTTILYLVPWREDWHQQGNIEFRVFCYHGKVTSISQYNWYNDIGLSKFESKEEACENIIKFCENDIVPKLSNETQGNWTIDIIYDFSTKKIELVEVNSFGCELAAGSGLFHWVRDKPVMYGEVPYVELRYVAPEDALSSQND